MKITPGKQATTSFEIQIGGLAEKAFKLLLTEGFNGIRAQIQVRENSENQYSLTLRHESLVHDRHCEVTLGLCFEDKSSVVIRDSDFRNRVSGQSLLNRLVDLIVTYLVKGYDWSDRKGQYFSLPAGYSRGEFFDFTVRFPDSFECFNLPDSFTRHRIFSVLCPAHAPHGSGSVVIRNPKVQNRKVAHLSKSLSSIGETGDWAVFFMDEGLLETDWKYIFRPSFWENMNRAPQSLNYPIDTTKLFWMKSRSLRALITDQYLSSIIGEVDLEEISRIYDKYGIEIIRRRKTFRQTGYVWSNEIIDRKCAFDIAMYLRLLKYIQQENGVFLNIERHDFFVRQLVGQVGTTVIRNPNAIQPFLV